MVSTSLLIGVTELYQDIGKWDGRIVDCRGASEYNRGHIPGAINVPNTLIQDPESDRGALLPVSHIQKNLKQAGIDLASEKPLVLYDDSGLVPSARLFWVLEMLGRNGAVLLDGGLISWLKEKYPLSKEPGVGEHCRENSQDNDDSFDPSRLATKDDVLVALNDPEVVLVDARSAEEYSGMKITAQRNGHIPGAVHINWEQHIGGLFDPVFKDPAELRRIYHEKGVSEDKTVIVYCRSGARSSHTYYTLRMLGFPSVKNYAASWLEWGNETDTPIE